MDVDLILIASTAIAGQVVWYGGGFLPIQSLVIQQDRRAAIRAFFQWALILLIAAPVVFILQLLLLQSAFFFNLLSLVNNVFLIVFGILTMIRIVRTSTLPEQSQIKKIVSIIAFVQTPLLLHPIARIYAVDGQRDLNEMVIMVLCFTISVLLQTALICAVLWLIASASRTKKLQRYLAGLFAFVCIVLGILNFL